MTSLFTPNRSDAIRAGLIRHVGSTRPRRRWLWAASLVTVGALAGAGVTAGAFAATSDQSSPPPESYGVGNGIVIEQPTGQPSPGLTDPVVAPPGVVPGSPVITVVGDPISLTVRSPAEIPLTDRPEEATHVRVTVTCLTVGTIVWGTDPSGDNPSSSCTASDAPTASGTAWLDLPLDSSTTTLYVTPQGEATASVALQYVSSVATLLGVNDNGETYGSGLTDQGPPDLILVEATGPDGGLVEGYARATDLNSFSPDHLRQPANPDQALTWQEERDEKYPDGWDIPVFESDGTQIGTFHIDN